MAEGACAASEDEASAATSVALDATAGTGGEATRGVRGAAGMGVGDGADGRVGGLGWLDGAADGVAVAVVALPAFFFFADASDVDARLVSDVERDGGAATGTDGVG